MYSSRMYPSILRRCNFFFIIITTILTLHFSAALYGKSRQKEEPFSRFGVGFGAEHHQYGGNVNLTLRYALKDRPFVFYAGVNYHINKANSGKLDGLDRDNYYNYFRVYDDRWAALNPGERLGFKLGVERYFKLQTDKYKLFVFYDFQKNTLSKQTYDVKTINLDSLHGNDTLMGHGYVYDHNYLLRNNVGVGLSINLFSGFYLKLIAGGGITLSGQYNPFNFGYMLGLQAHWNLLTKSR